MPLKNLVCIASLLQRLRVGSCLYAVFMRRPQRSTYQTNSRRLERSRICTWISTDEPATWRFIFHYFYANCVLLIILFLYSIKRITYFLLEQIIILSPMKFNTCRVMRWWSTARTRRLRQLSRSWTAPKSSGRRFQWTLASSRAPHNAAGNAFPITCLSLCCTLKCTDSRMMIVDRTLLYCKFCTNDRH